MPVEVAVGVSGNVFLTFVFLLVSGYLFYWALAATSYFFFFVWKKDRFNPDFQPRWKENFQAMKLGFYSILGNAVLTAPIHVLIAQGKSKIYYDVADFGWGYLLVSVVLLLVITETLVYWAHRILHMPFFYRYIHKHHHKFSKPTPWVGVAFHPLDSFAQGFPHHLCAFLFPMHATVYLTTVLLITIWAVSIHDRVSILRLGLINYAGHHTMHHYYNDHNYGQYTTIWDRLCGTYRSPRKTEYWPPRQALASYAPSS